MSGRGRRADPGRDRGAADVLGVVLLAPAIIGLALVVLYLGRQVDARAQVRAAAEAAAQAAALERSRPAAIAAAERAARATLVDTDSCASVGVSVTLDHLAPGATVAVEVRCAVSDRGVAMLGVGSRTVASSAVAVFDPYRAVER